MRVLFLNKYTAGGPSSRYRVLQFLPYLEARGIQATVQALHDDRYLTSRYSGAGSSPFYLAHRVAARLATLASATQYDLVFIQKEMFPHMIDWPEKWLSSRGVRYVVDLDDAIHLMYSGASGWKRPLRNKIERVLAHAGLVLAGNRYLEEYAGRFNENVLFFPTVVDTAKFHPANPRDSGNPRDSADTKRVVVGWMGTPETVKYLNEIVPALEAAGERIPLSLLVVGAPAPATRGLNVIARPWSEATEADDLRAMDIGLMPLADDEWSKGKCSLKLIQYMSAGVASVSSPGGSTLEFVRDGDNAFVAAAADEWSDRITDLAQSPERRSEMGSHARATIESDYSLHVWGPRFAAALEWAASGARERAPAWNTEK